MRRLPGIQASPIVKPGKGQYKPDPAEMSDIYTSDSAVKGELNRVVLLVHKEQKCQKLNTSPTNLYFVCIMCVQLLKYYSSFEATQPWKVASL